MKKFSVLFLGLFLVSGVIGCGSSNSVEVPDNPDTEVPDGLGGEDPGKGEEDERLPTPPSGPLD